MLISELYPNHNHPILEASYKEIKSLYDTGFLDLHLRSKQVPAIKFIGVDANTIRFKTNRTLSGNQYLNLFRFKQWDQMVADTDLTPQEAAKLLLWSGDLEMYCNCPSFKYWGYQYLLTVIDASIVPELRKPRIRNPLERGICCKHLYASMRLLPFHLGDIAKAITIQRKEE